MMQPNKYEKYIHSVINKRQYIKNFYHKEHIFNIVDIMINYFAIFRFKMVFLMRIAPCKPA